MNRRSLFKTIVGAFVAVALDLQAAPLPVALTEREKFEKLLEEVCMYNANASFESLYITGGLLDYIETPFGKVTMLKHPFLNQQ